MQRRAARIAVALKSAGLGTSGASHQQERIGTIASRPVELQYAVDHLIESELVEDTRAGGSTHASTE